MRLGIVRGRVVLNLCTPALAGVRLVIVEPLTASNLAARNGLGGGKALVAVDQIGAAEGQTVGFVEGREAANPWWPLDAPVDAYCAVVADQVDFRPPDLASPPEERK
jgi:microcompartment protein CcmK/EutM